MLIGWSVPGKRKYIALVTAAAIALTLFDFSGARPGGVQSASGAGPTPPPSSISLTSNRGSIAAGQTARLVATTDVSVQGSASTVEIVDAVTNAVVGSCVTGRTCVQEVSFDRGDAHEYFARVGNVESNRVIVERKAWALTLTASRSTLLAGQSSIITAVSNQDVGLTNGAFVAYIFDAANGTLVASCATGKVCRAVVSTLYDNDDYARGYVAAVAAAGDPARVEDAEDIQVTSESVTVQRAPWEITLTSQRTELDAGTSTVVTAVSNQDVGKTNGKYALYIVDVQHGDRIVACTSGKVCRLTTTWADTSDGRPFVAFIAAVGEPQSYDELIDIQMGSQAVYVQQKQWTLDIQSDRDTIGAGDRAVITVTANQNLTRAGSAYSIYIFESATHRLVKKCSVGMVCKVGARLYGPEDDLYSGRYFYAVLAQTADVTAETTSDDLQNSKAWSNWISVDRIQWTVDLVRDDDAVVPDGRVQFTATTNQLLDKTRGRDALYLFDSESGELLGRCLTGSECIFTVDGKLPTGRAVFAAIAERTQPASLDEASSIQAGSETLTTSDEYWALSLEADTLVFAAGASSTLTATANHDLNVTSKNLEITIFDTTSGTVVGQCFYGTTCTASASFPSGGPHHYQAVIAGPGAASIDTADDLQAVSSAIELSRQPWEVNLTANKAELLAGETAVVTAVANQNLDFTGGKYQLAIFDKTTGKVVKSCKTTTICVWQPTALYFADGLHTYIALVIDAKNTPTMADAEDTQATSNDLTFEIAPWTLTLNADVPVFPTGSVGKITATGNQNIGLTGDSLAIYYFDLSDGSKRVKECTAIGPNAYVANVCTANVLFYNGEPHTYVAVVAKKTNPATLADAVGVLATSNTVEVARAPWEVVLQVYPNAGFGYTRLVAVANQNPWLTNQTFSMYILGSSGVASYCNPYLTCDVYTLPHSGESFTAYVASADAPYVHDIQATSATFYEPIIGGPTNAGETAGGGNPSEANCQCMQGDPVNTATGEFYQPERDLSIPGSGPAVGIGRTYSSTHAAVDGPFGFGWNSNFSSRIKVITAGTSTNPHPVSVRVIQENGSTVDFTRDALNVYRAPLRVQATIAFDDSRQTWVFVRQRTEVFEYDVAGHLTAIKDLHGNAVTISYDAQGNANLISASGGRSLTLTWQGGHVTQVADSAGRQVHYGYDGSGNLTSAGAADGRVTGYGYDAGHYMTTVVSPGGATLHNTYDSSHRVVLQTDPLNRATSFAYSGSKRTITSPGTRRVEETYNSTNQLVAQTIGLGTPLARTSAFAYDNANNLASVTNPLGENTTKTFDQYGDVVSLTDALGSSSNWTYDSLGNPTSSTDNLGRTSSATYSAQGDLLSTTSQAGVVQSWTFNADGTVKSAIDGNGKQTTFGYDAAGRLNSTTSADGRTSTVVFGSDGIPTMTTDSGGNATHIVSDAAGRALTITDPNGAATTFGYDSLGDRVSVTDPAGHTTVSTLDLLGRTVSQSDAAGAVTSSTFSTAGDVATTTDAAGRITSYGYDAIGQLTSVTDANGNTTTYTYDNAGRRLSRTLPSGAVSTVQYDELGRARTITDENGEPTSYQYDEASQVLSVRDPLDRITTAHYGADGELISTDLPSGAELSFTYDPTGRLTGFVNADGKSTTYTYSDAGLLLGKVEPGGLSTQYQYDSAERLHAVTQPDGSTTTASYDSAGRLVRSHSSVAGSVDSTFDYDAASKLVGKTDSSGSSIYAYDSVGRMVSETNGAGATISYSYDASGLLLGIAYPGRGDVSYTYDPAGQMSSVTDWLGNSTSYSWSDDGRLESRTDPSGVVESRTYDQAGSTTGISIASPEAVLASFTYGLDAAGQLTSSTTDNGGASSSTFGYDADGQLSSVSISGSSNADQGPVLTTPAGQVLSTTSGQTFTYNSAQQLTAAQQPGGADTVFGYSGNGSRTSSTSTLAGGAVSSTTYSYDSAGNLAQAVTPWATVSYTSDSSGLRQSRTAGGVTKDFTWSTVAGIALLLDDSDWSYIYGPSTAPIAQISDATDEVQYLYGDVIGSVRVIADAEGSPIATSEFSAFGTRVSHTGTADSAFGYSGNWTDAITGLVYLRARDYDPATAQFLTVDPAVDATHQPYAYAANNPLLLTDPLGLYACDDYGHNASVFLLGALDGATFGISSLILGFVNPGYNSFVEGNGWFYGGMAVGTLAITAATAGIGGGVAAASLGGRMLIAGASREALALGERAIATGGREWLASTVEHAGSSAVDRVAAQGTERIPNAVIGKTTDLKALAGSSLSKPRNGEYSLLSKLPNKGSPRANWKQNSSVLREEMQRRVPIRDASWGPGENIMQQYRTSFLGAERNLLSNRGWTFDRTTSFWMPPVIG